jgi:hypothetical protein
MACYGFNVKRSTAAEVKSKKSKVKKEDVNKACPHLPSIENGAAFINVD